MRQEAVATDGLHFRVYRPQYDETGRVAGLEKIQVLNLASPMMTPERAVRKHPATREISG